MVPALCWSRHKIAAAELGALGHVEFITTTCFATPMIKNRLYSAFLLILMVALLLVTSACATAILNDSRQDAGEPLKELSGMKKPLEGTDLGNAQLHGTKYRKLLIPSARHACNSSKAVELLLPLQADSQERAILREEEVESSATGPRVLVYERIQAGPPVKGDVKPERPTNEEILNWLEDFPMPEEGLSAIIFGYDGSGNRRVVMYKIGTSPVGAQTVLVTSDLDWVCRSRLRYALLLSSYPIAVALDIATLPIQIVLIILSAH